MNIGRTIKEKGVVYTPQYIVSMVLDEAGYFDKKIIKKHVIDNSCGDGAFLLEIVKRYIENYLIIENNIFTLIQLKIDLETYIHGIEIDLKESIKAKSNLDQFVLVYGLENVNWDVINSDTLKNSDYLGKMDYVVGNPPYVRVHNLKDDLAYIKSNEFNKSGMTDLYILFYDIGIKMLNVDGVLSYITPSSVFNSLAGENLRVHLIKNKLISRVLDLKHHQPFKNITTYTTIMTIKSNNQFDKIDYFELDIENQTPNFVSKLKYSDFFINNSFYFSDNNKLSEFKKIMSLDTRNDNFQVKNGFATLSDNFFFKDKFHFDSKFIKKVIKVSNMSWKEMIYPYENGNLVNFSKFEDELKHYYLANKLLLNKRSLDKNTEWFAFGRSQGVNDFECSKIVVSTLLRSKKDIKILEIDAGIGVYSGLYIIGNINAEFIRNILLDDNFVNYVKIIGKYKSGGYYTFSSRDLKKYISFKIEEKIYE